MSETLLAVASWAAIVLGVFFVIVGALGLLRMPDVYTRLHGVSVIDTAGAGFLILGMALQAGISLISLKLLFILAVFFFTLPVVAHALAQAALNEKLEPQLNDDRRGRQQNAQTGKDERGKP